MAESRVQALSAADVKAIVERDVPGFTLVPSAGGAADFGQSLAADAATIAVRIKPQRATDAPTPFPRGRTVLIDMQKGRVRGAQG